MRAWEGCAAAVLAVFAAMPANAVRGSLPDAAGFYVRARTAAAAGDSAVADARFASLLARQPGNGVVAAQALSQGVQGGDMPLALRAARILDALGALPPDARLLLIADAVRGGDWPAASAATDRVEREHLLGFLAPLLRGWIALGARQGDPLALIQAARAQPMAAPYVSEQTGLILIAQGKIEPGIAALQAIDARGIVNKSIRLRLIAADALAGEGERTRALALLDGPDPSLAAARARIAAGLRLPAPIDNPAAGVAALLTRVASDLGRDRLAPLALVMARAATLAAPADASGWLVTADVLDALHRPGDALAALGHIAPDDPLASPARALKVALLTATGAREAALKQALDDAATRDTGAEGWARVGDVDLALNKPADAADAYARALAAADAAKLPGVLVWPLWLQRGSALDLAGDWPRAKAALQKALALAPDEAVVLNQFGYGALMHHDDVAGATAMIARAAALRPDDPAITDSLGWTRYLGGDTKTAVPLLERAAGANPDEPTINEHLGDAYWSAGRRYEARYAWRAALITAEAGDRARLQAKIDLGLSRETAAP